MGFTTSCSKIPVKNKFQEVAVHESGFLSSLLRNGTCLHLALNFSPSRYRFCSQTDLGWSAICHFIMVPSEASYPTCLRSDVFSVKWVKQNEDNNTIHMQQGCLTTRYDKIYRALDVLLDSVKIDTHSLFPLIILVFGRLFKNIS